MQKTLDKRISQIEQSLQSEVEDSNMEQALNALSALFNRLKLILPEPEYTRSCLWVLEGDEDLLLAERSNVLEKIAADQEAKELLRNFFVESLVYAGLTKQEAQEHLLSRRWDYNPFADCLKEYET